jgi:hypothetical protein
VVPLHELKRNLTTATFGNKETLAPVIRFTASWTTMLSALESVTPVDQFCPAQRELGTV